MQLIAKLHNILRLRKVVSSYVKDVMLRVTDMTASALFIKPAPDRNTALVAYIKNYIAGIG